MVPAYLQLELSVRLERERLEASLADAAAAKQRLTEQLAVAQQVGSGDAKAGAELERLVVSPRRLSDCIRRRCAHTPLRPAASLKIHVI
jgi:hypothetical protein